MGALLMVALPQMVSPTVSAIEAAVEIANKERRRTYLGGSVIGKPCERALWYEFRWAHDPERFEGRMLRLFGMGHSEEARMIAWLELAGIRVRGKAEDQQIAVSACGGHFRGHLDGELHGVIEAPKTPHLLECKTHSAKSFAQLVKHGVAVAKPEHVAQMQVYMHLHGLTRAFYLAENKDTSELYAERIEYDAAQAASLMAKAERIIFSDNPPARISDNPDSFACRFCPALLQCHAGSFANRNCRTCLHATPLPESSFGDGKWRCNRHDIDLGPSVQEHGCPHHLFLPGLVPGEQIDVDQQAETVTYRMGDGSEWKDGGASA